MRDGFTEEPSVAPALEVIEAVADRWMLKQEPQLLVDGVHGLRVRCHKAMVLPLQRTG